jgi:hypothetical protein
MAGAGGGTGDWDEWLEVTAATREGEKEAHGEALSFIAMSRTIEPTSIISAQRLICIGAILVLDFNVSPDVKFGPLL